MSNAGLRLGAIWEDLRSSLWLWPTLAVLLAFALGNVLSIVRVQVPDEVPSLLDLVLFGGGKEAARGLLQTIAGAIATITSLVFSLTVVALQLATTNYSPRLLRGFLRDVGNQLVLSTFLATFAYSYAVLRTLPGGQEDEVPVVAMNTLLVFVAGSLAALVYFLNHLTQQLRVEVILDGVRDETLATIERRLGDPDPGGSERARDGLPAVPPHAVALPARRSGVVQAWALEPLAEGLREADLVLRLRPRVGEYVVAGTVIAWAWADGSGSTAKGASAQLGEQLQDALQVGGERTMQQDVGFGLRQLSDIAVRALSPGINDPTTAADALSRSATILAALAVRPLPNTLCHDGEGVLRVAAPTPDFDEYLDVACDEIRQYGAGDARVVRKLLTLLDAVGSLVTQPERTAAIDEQVHRVLAAGRRQLTDEVDLAGVERAAAQARRPLNPP